MQRDQADSAIGGVVPPKDEAGAATARPPSRVVTVQYLRAVAAGLVVLHHAFSVPALAPYYGKPFGIFGVDLFFVISGFIMWTTTADRDRGPLKFWSARIIRVIPLYWIFTSLYIFAAILIPSSLFNAALDLEHILKSYFFIPAEHPRLGNILPVYTLGWTLNYEMFFYLVFGIGLFIPTRAIRLAAVLGGLTLLVAIGALVAPSQAVASTYTNPLLLEFAAGILIGRLAPRLGAAPPGLGWAVMAGAVAWLVIAYSGAGVPSEVVAHGVPASAMLAGALILERAARKRPLKLALFLGDASYSLYLSHPFAQRLWYIVVDRLVGMTSIAVSIVFLLGAILVSLIAGAVTHLLVERPILAAGRHLAHIPNGGEGLRVPRAAATPASITASPEADLLERDHG